MIDYSTDKSCHAIFKKSLKIEYLNVVLDSGHVSLSAECCNIVSRLEPAINLVSCNDSI